jgi:N-acetylglucosamine-6-phosphate deacetylase
VSAQGGVITDISPSSSSTTEWIAPGLIDIQVNGMGGFNLNGVGVDVDSVKGTLEALHREGVTRFCPTIVTGTKENILANIRTVAMACETSPLVEHAVIGIHIEGPFISREDGPRGAHNPDWVRPPDWDEFLDWQRAAGGRIKQVTVAPETTGAIEFIERLVGSGVVASIGHSAATPDDVRAAVSAGATMSTHLGNGCHVQLRRHPNHIWTQLAEDRQWASFIPDGFHIPADALSVMIRAKGSKAIITSDASYLAQLPAGTYRTHHGADVVLEPDGMLHLASTRDILAGSAATLRTGVKNLANFGIMSVGEAIELASLHPAELFGIHEEGAGTLRVGGAADLILYSWTGEQGSGEMAIHETVSRGELVFAA